MKKIIPFQKEIAFKTNVSEITSIALEHTLHIEEHNVITGEFLISGDYRIADTSVNTEIFSYQLPFDISMDEHYILDKVQVDIDDFYYEVVNNNLLLIHIDVAVDRLEERLIVETVAPTEEKIVEVASMDRAEDIIEASVVEPPMDFKALLEAEEEEDLNEEIDVKKQTFSMKKESHSMKVGNSIFDSFDDSSETYTTYKICIIREGDNLESILMCYSVTREILEQYNDLKELKLGDKLIIPALRDETN